MTCTRIIFFGAGRFVIDVSTVCVGYSCSALNFVLDVEFVNFLYREDVRTANIIAADGSGVDCLCLDRE
jgi:hypothetical protein